jgi:energy-coupling factor transporter transmembrane protein EcfT
VCVRVCVCVCVCVCCMWFSVLRSWCVCVWSGILVTIDSQPTKRATPHDFFLIIKLDRRFFLVPSFLLAFFCWYVIVILFVWKYAALCHWWFATIWQISINKSGIIIPPVPIYGKIIKFTAHTSIYVSQKSILCILLCVLYMLRRMVYD